MLKIVAIGFFTNILVVVVILNIPKLARFFTFKTTPPESSAIVSPPPEPAIKDHPKGPTPEQIAKTIKRHADWETRLAIALARVEDQKRDYGITATRVADFLILEVTGVIRWDGDVPVTQTENRCINLSLCTQILREIGALPTKVEEKIQYVNGYDIINGYFSSADYGRWLFSSIHNAYDGAWSPYMGSRVVSLEQTIMNLRPGKDAQITFEGCDLVLYVPHGFEDLAFATILDAIQAEYSPPPPLSFAL